MFVSGRRSDQYEVSELISVPAASHATHFSWKAILAHSFIPSVNIQGWIHSFNCWGSYGKDVPFGAAVVGNIVSTTGASGTLECLYRRKQLKRYRSESAVIHTTCNYFTHLICWDWQIIDSKLQVHPLNIFSSWLHTQLVNVGRGRQPGSDEINHSYFVCLITVLNSSSRASYLPNWMHFLQEMDAVARHIR